MAGFAALTGPLHGGASIGLVALANLADRLGTEEALRRWMEQRRPLTAFGHRLYPDGDVRATHLLAMITVPPRLAALSAEVSRAVGEHPNVDFALTAVAEAFALPSDAPLALFAIARSVGWIAHGLEQRANGGLIRPRARYVGPELRPASSP
jgi:citrate synthase